MSEKFTYHQVEEQQAAGHENPTVLVPHQDGRIIVGKRELIGGKLYATFVDNGEDMVREASEPAFSDQAQHHFALELAQSAERDAKAWQHEGDELFDDTQETENYDETILTEIGELVQNFRRRHADAVSESLARSSQQLQHVDTYAQMLNQFKYGSLSKEAFIRDSQNLLWMLQPQARTEAETDQILMRDARQLESGLEEAIADSRGELSDEAYQQVRRVGNAVQEVSSHVRTLGYIDDEISSELTKVLSLIDNFGYDTWGAETYMAQFQQAADTLEQTIAQRRGRLSYIENELSYMR